MSQRSVGFLCWAVSAVLSVAWLVEAFMVGRGFISSYLAPFAIVGNLAGMLLMRRGAKP
jgi:hypothetical protein